MKQTDSARKTKTAAKTAAKPRSRQKRPTGWSRNPAEVQRIRFGLRRAIQKLTPGSYDYGEGSLVYGNMKDEEIVTVFKRLDDIYAEVYRHD